MDINWAKRGKSFSHACEHYQDMDSLEDVMPGISLWARFRRSVMSMFLVSSKNYRTFGYLRSKMAIEQERSRHLRVYFYTIHPFSCFRMWWEILVIAVMYITVVLNYVHTVWLKEEHVISSILVISYFIGFIDFILNCITGVCNNDTKDIVMHRSTIIWSYVKGLLIFDVVPGIPFALLYDKEDFILIDGKQQICLLSIFRFLSLLKILRVVRIMVYYKNTMKAFNVPYSVSRICGTVIVSSIVIHFIACSNFYIASAEYQYRDGDLLKYSWIMSIIPLELSMFDEYLHSLVRVITITWHLCFDYYGVTTLELYSTVLLMVVGQMLFFFLIAEVMHITKIQKASSSGYEEMIVQLIQFMNHKRLPPNIQSRILEYHEFRYNKSYYVEAEIMNSLSAQIKQDVIVHKCRDLVERVQFFANLPNDLKLRIVSCMRTAYYLENDTIIDLNGKGDCMYFIKSGTVGVYSSTGKEICHLEDGDNFGEISLLLEAVNRVASVVALESCELLLLERIHFLNAVEPYPEVYESLKRVAEQRLLQTQTMDADDENIVAGF